MTMLSIKNGAGTVYSLKCVNNSLTPWVFCVYQQNPDQSNPIYSTAWLVSPFKIAPSARISFEWTLDLSFVWSYSGVLEPGVKIDAGEVLPCSLNGANQTTFKVIDNTPQFSPVTVGEPQDVLSIMTDSTIPNAKFSTGIGMSGQCIMLTQALMNMRQSFSLPAIPMYYVCAMNQVQMGEVLEAESTQAQSFQFPANVYGLTATLAADNTWTIQ